MRSAPVYNHHSILSKIGVSNNIVRMNDDKNHTHCDLIAINTQTNPGIMGISIAEPSSWWTRPLTRVPGHTKWGPAKRFLDRSPSSPSGVAGNRTPVLQHHPIMGITVILHDSHGPRTMRLAHRQGHGYPHQQAKHTTITTPRRCASLGRHHRQHACRFGRWEPPARHHDSTTPHWNGHGAKRNQCEETTQPRRNPEH